MRYFLASVLLPVITTLSAPTFSQEAPPYSSTVYIDPNWITSDDPSAYKGKTYLGRETVTMFDRRINSWVNVDTFSYALDFGEEVNVVGRVNTEFSEAEASQIVEKWANVLGQMPLVLLARLGELHLQPGDEYMGGNDSTNPTHVLIHTEHADRNYTNGWAEEEILHELSHATLQHLQSTKSWLNAQTNDPCYISSYAQNNSDREDVAESLAPYLVARLRADRLSAIDEANITRCIPNRVAVFDDWFADSSTDFFPWIARESTVDTSQGLPIWLLWHASQRPTLPSQN
jgi:hypothetical protein